MTDRARNISVSLKIKNPCPPPPKKKIKDYLILQIWRKMLVSLLDLL